MNPDRPLRLTVEIDSAQPLSGRIGASGMPMQAFNGWLGLATHLELFVGEGSKPQARPTDEDGTAGKPPQ